jgi:copper(I)-binding protein
MTLTLGLSLALLGGCPATPTADGGIRADDARVRELLPGQDKTVAYLDLTNAGPEPITLIEARSRHARAIEIHQHTRNGNMISMRRVKSIPIPSSETVRLAPGGLHLMLFGVDTLAPSIEIQLLWAHGQVVNVPFRRVTIGAP